MVFIVFNIIFYFFVDSLCVTFSVFFFFVLVDAAVAMVACFVSI